jgi:hypothetical protein
MTKASPPPRCPSARMCLTEKSVHPACFPTIRAELSGSFYSRRCRPGRG